MSPPSWADPAKTGSGRLGQQPYHEIPCCSASSPGLGYAGPDSGWRVRPASELSRLPSCFASPTFRRGCSPAFMGESLMDIDHWYRCSVCGYRYTPQQVVALLELLASRAGESASQRHDPERIPCRKK